MDLDNGNLKFIKMVQILWVQVQVRRVDFSSELFSVELVIFHVHYNTNVNSHIVKILILVAQFHLL